MKLLLSLALLPWLLLPTAGLAAGPRSGWEKSVVRIEVSHNVYDYYQPWNRRSETVSKTGVVVGKTQILTTAENLSDRTLIRVQAGGRGAWANATVVWVDYYANLAVLTTPAPDFWSGLKPVTIPAKPSFKKDGLQILRWREGKLESRQAEFSQFAVRKGRLSDINQVFLEASSEIQAAGDSEPVVSGSQLVGLVIEQSGRNCKILPGAFLHMILSAHARAHAQAPRLGYFHFYWQPAENTDSLAYLGLPGKPRGVLVIEVSPRLDGQPNVLQPQDIILQIDNFDIDMQGDYADPDYGLLMLENLATRNRWAGDAVHMKIWRTGQVHDVIYRLPQYDFTNSLVPAGVFDQPADYLIVGGLVFQPLTVPYLQRWGGDRGRNALFRLNYYREDEATKARPSLVILSQVLPDRFNIGYQEYRGLVVEKINGQTVHHLSQIQAALEKPTGPFHVIDFVPNETVQRVVIAAGEREQTATARVLENFGISAAAQITPQPATAN